MSITAYFVDLSDKDRIRVKIVTERNKIIGFTVQQESYINGKWREIIRYNHAHGKPHKDIIHTNGGIDKKWINEFDLSKIVTMGITDIKKNWGKYINKYKEEM